ncbi:hypothetical protein BDQ17DRAFT_1247767 [Cyathus striatus]|nr:hypothetical protein BDQ17DRAFT_1247767 [Cyathus striatus]
MSTETLALFKSIKVGALSLQHRVVLAPLTRLRNSKTTSVPHNPLVKDYYTQRASRPGTLLITESTFIAPQAAGFPNMPGIWSKEQIAAWKEVTESVHAKGSFIFLQLLAAGRAADPAAVEALGYPYIGPSPIPPSYRPTPLPRELTTSEIAEYVELYAQGACNAIEAGFDGVEIHGANGCLVDQFLQDVTNQRTDAYGGSIENRSRFALEIVGAVSKAIGADRVGIRLAPWSTFQEMRMKDPIPQFAHFVSTLKHAQPDLAYLHLIEPRIAGPDGDEHDTSNLHSGNDSVAESNDFLRAIWKPKALISAGGYIRESALIRAEEKGDIIAFGRRFIANPDLVDRLENDIPLTKYNRDTFYIPAEAPNAADGYVDYPFVEKN